MDAQDSTLAKPILRQQLKERKRYGQSWYLLSGPSSLLVLAYSEKAECIVKNFKKVNGALMRKLAPTALAKCSEALIYIASRLDKEVELATDCGLPYGPVTSTQIVKFIANKESEVGT
ncbi:hypothetical protein QQS21_011649 [Conoideocrella luteorostrata]|uniref:Uncharacterized protein n=1 Tax=Conoideocrella luteorostrata TaxID=1105319 RepID=A0AAJ0FT65_9HYPO|nr:hypothetical protein QQS21_011649 [Conoideocrella luteorostrata]